MSQDTLKRLERLAWLMDSSLMIPGTRFRVGLDPVLGLIPVVGDFAGMLVSLYFLAEALNLQLPRRDLARMMLWIGMDGALGLVPVVGDLFDFGFKSNQKMLKLLQTRAARLPISVMHAD